MKGKGKKEDEKDFRSLGYVHHWQRRRLVVPPTQLGKKKKRHRSRESGQV